MKTDKRKRVFADLKIQGGICLRITIYWFACYFVTIGTIFGFASLDGASATGTISRFFVPAFVAATLVLPLVLLDILVFSNRFAGPLLSFRRRLKHLADGEQTGQELRFRNGDYFLDISENFNIIRSKLLEKEDI